MTDQPSLFSRPIETRRWRVSLADGEVRTVAAHGFRIEHGALVLVLPAGCAAAWAPGAWHAIEAEGTP
jgi:hypothetical protein